MIFVKYPKSSLFFVFLIGVFLLPFIFWLKAPIPYEIPRVWFVQRWVEVLGVISLIFLLVKSREKDRPVAINWWVIAFVSIAILASFLGSDWSKSLWGNYYRDDGLFTLFHLVGLYFFLTIFWEDAWKKPVCLAVAGGSIVVSLWTIIDGFKLLILNDRTVPNWSGAIGVSFGQPNFLAGYLVVSLPFVYFALRSFVSHSRIRIRVMTYTIILGIQIAAIGLTQSWGGMLGVSLFLLGAVVLTYPLSAGELRQFTLMSIVLAIFIGIFFLIRPTSFVAESRNRIAHKLLLSVAKRPILGWGWANVDHAFDSSIWPIKLNPDVYVDKAHSTLLEVLATTGIVGLSFYLILLVSIGKQLLSRVSTATDTYFYKILLLTFLLYIIHAQTNIISIAEELFFWMIAAMAVA